MQFVTGFKATHGSDLTQEQTNYNFAHAQERNKIERYFGILKSRFQFLYDGYRGPLAHFRRLSVFAMCIVNEIIRLFQNRFSHEEESIINHIILTDLRHSPLEQLELVQQSTLLTFPEVVLNPETGEHYLIWDATEEQRRWEGRNRALRDGYPTFQFQPRRDRNAPRGSNLEVRILGQVRPRPQSMESDDQTTPIQPTH